MSRAAFSEYISCKISSGNHYMTYERFPVSSKIRTL